MTIRRSNGDQQGAGQRLGPPRGRHHDTCPTRTLAAWTRHLPTDSNVLFRAVDRHGNIAIARQTRHRSMDVLHGYIRDGDLFPTNAATSTGDATASR